MPRRACCQSLTGGVVGLLVNPSSCGCGTSRAAAGWCRIRRRRSAGHGQLAVAPAAQIQLHGSQGSVPNRPDSSSRSAEVTTTVSSSALLTVRSSRAPGRHGMPAVSGTGPAPTLSRWPPPAADSGRDRPPCITRPDPRPAPGAARMWRIHSAGGYAGSRADEPIGLVLVWSS
jgi:hypothetical protein